MILKLYLILGSFSFTYSFFSARVCGNWCLLFALFPLPSALWCLCGWNDPSGQTWLLMGFSWFWWAPASPPPFYFPFLISDCVCVYVCMYVCVCMYIYVCVVYWCLMLFVSDWEDCHWYLVLSIMNLFLSTTEVLFWRHLVSSLGSW